MESNHKRKPEDDGTITEGRNAVLELLRSGRPVDKVFIAEGARGTDIIAEARKRGVPVSVCDRHRIDRVSRTGKHQGVIAQAAAQEYVTLDAILETAEKRGEPPLVVVCDSIEDPHNLGAIIRSAEAAGAHGVVIPKHRASGLTAATAKASAGALTYMNVHKAVNLASVLNELKNRGIWVFGAEADGNTTLYDAPFDRPAALVIGSEGRGLSRLIREKCDYVVSIPMKGKINSLNASNAAALLLFEALRRRMVGN